MPPIGTRVRVHFNLRTRLWSITINGTVVADVAEVTLRDVTRHIWRGRDGSDGRGKTGQQLSLVGKRTVHAWFVGTISKPHTGAETEITYHPRRDTEFTTRDGTRVYGARFVRFDSQRKAWGIGLTLTQGN